MGGTYSTQYVYESCIHILMKYLEVRDRLEYLGLNGRILLKWMLKK